MKLYASEGSKEHSLAFECVPDGKCESCELRFKCYTASYFIFQRDLTEHETHVFFEVSGIWGDELI